MYTILVTNREGYTEPIDEILLRARDQYDTFYKEAPLLAYLKTHFTLYFGYSHIELDNLVRIHLEPVRDKEGIYAYEISAKIKHAVAVYLLTVRWDPENEGRNVVPYEDDIAGIDETDHFNTLLKLGEEIVGVQKQEVLVKRVSPHEVVAFRQCRRNACYASLYKLVAVREVTIENLEQYKLPPAEVEALIQVIQIYKAREASGAFESGGRTGAVKKVMNVADRLLVGEGVMAFLAPDTDKAIVYYVDLPSEQSTFLYDVEKRDFFLLPIWSWIGQWESQHPEVGEIDPSAAVMVQKATRHSIRYGKTLPLIKPTEEILEKIPKKNPLKRFKPQTGGQRDIKLYYETILGERGYTPGLVDSLMFGLDMTESILKERNETFDKSWQALFLAIFKETQLKHPRAYKKWMDILFSETARLVHDDEKITVPNLLREFEHISYFTEEDAEQLVKEVRKYEIAIFESIHRYDPNVWTEKIFETSQEHGEAAYRIITLANSVLGGSGVEAITVEGYEVDKHYYYGAVAQYVNLGLPETTTIVFDTEKREFLITSWGGWYEEWQIDHAGEYEEP